MGLLIKADGTRQEIQGEEESGSLSYEQLKEAVGDYIEMVSCDPEITGGYDHYYCNEEGKIIGLPANHVATHLSTYTSPFDVVCGDVIFCKGDDEGNSY